MPMESFETFCNHLANAIRLSPFSRAKLAEKLGVKPATIKSWCVGRRSPTVFRLLELCEILGVESHDLFQEPTQPLVRSECSVCHTPQKESAVGLPARAVCGGRRGALVCD